jgi:trans-L-3-hydroxyproline dehydratase
MTAPYWIQTEDWHTCGEPFRIVPTLPTSSHLPPGATVSARRTSILETPPQPGHPLDILRQSLCHEPRGHGAMYGCFIVPPNDGGAHLGVLFWHKDGFSTACGHGTIALGYWAVSSGRVGLPAGSSNGSGVVDVVVDVPSGRVVARVAVHAGKPVHADFVNVASYLLAGPVSVAVPSRGVEVAVDLGFGGAVYAAVDAAQLGLAVEAGAYGEFVRVGREIKAALGDRGHYAGYDLYGVIFFTDEGDEAGVVRQTNVTVFADGQVDRSPCGSGTCARVAMLFAQGRLWPGRSKLVHRSIVGTAFEADILSEEKSPVDGGGPACIPRVRGQANLVGKMNFYIDPNDPVFPGFLLG